MNFLQNVRKRMYLDYASLTPIDREVMRTMDAFSTTTYANPSSWYKEGVEAKKVLDASRRTVAQTMNAHEDEIVFTSGGTEANNIALMGTVEARHTEGVPYERMHIIVSAIEHSSVMACADALERKGVRVDRIPVDTRGCIDLESFKKALSHETVIVSVMMVNNEIGSIQPIRDIARIIRKVKGPLFHTDACQAYAYLDIDMRNLGVDLLTLDGAKIYGPRGIGALYKKRGVHIAPIIYGGGQEFGLRSGTEQIPSIAGFACAIEIAREMRDAEAVRVSALKQSFIQGVQHIRHDISVNGDGHVSVPHIVNISIPGIDSEYMVFQLDAKGVACSTKSSCLRDEDESYVLKAIGAVSGQSIRFSFGRFTSQSDIQRALNAIRGIILA